MQLEDLQRQWRQLDHKLDRSIALQTELVRQALIPPARRRVNRLAIWPAIDLVVCVGVLLLGGTFLADRWRDSRLLLPAGTVMACALALLIDSMWQLQRVAEIDWAGPVADIQCSLDKLRVAKIRQFKWILLLSPLLWFCGLMVGICWLLDWASGSQVNLLDKFDPRWIAGNYLFGVLFVPAGHFVAGLLASLCRRHSWWQGFLDGIAGNSLKAATRDVEHWGSLLRETRPSEGA